MATEASSLAFLPTAGMRPEGNWSMTFANPWEKWVGHLRKPFVTSSKKPIQETMSSFVMTTSRRGAKQYANSWLGLEYPRTNGLRSNFKNKELSVRRFRNLPKPG